MVRMYRIFVCKIDNIIKCNLKLFLKNIIHSSATRDGLTHLDPGFESRVDEPVDYEDRWVGGHEAGAQHWLLVPHLHHPLLQGGITSGAHKIALSKTLCRIQSIPGIWTPWTIKTEGSEATKPALSTSPPPFSPKRYIGYRAFQA